MRRSIILGIFSVMCTCLSAQGLKSVVYNDEAQKLNGLLTDNAGKSLPGVLILPAWKGADEEAKNAALALQKEGYMAFIADIYGVGNTPETDEEAEKMFSIYSTDYAKYQKRIKLALEQLKKAGADKVAVIGYCFGGLGTLEVMRAGMPVVGIVCIHGGLGKDAARTNEKIETKVLVEHPAEDKSVTPEQLQALIKELRDGEADWQLITYANSGHTFTNPKSTEYNPIMAKRAWTHTLQFLKEVLHN